MLNFVKELEDVLARWPENEKWSITQLADKTKTSLPYVFDFLSQCMDKVPPDVHEPVLRKEIEKAHATLKHRLRGEIEAQKRKAKRQQEKAIEALDSTYEKVRVLETAKNYRSAYLTLKYFFGIYEEHLTPESLATISNDCLRVGTKAGINYQELGIWLKRGIKSILNEITQASLEEAFDLIDAFAAIFLSSSGGVGEKILLTILQDLQKAALEVNVLPQFTHLVNDLKLSSREGLIV